MNGMTATMINIPEPERETYPVQATARSHPSKSASVNKHVYLAAYEVYSAVFAPQEAMLIGNCRSGFSPGELIAYLYARGFPRAEWRQRFDEAITDMDLK